MLRHFLRSRAAITGGHTNEQQSAICFLPVIGSKRRGPRRWKAPSGVVIRPPKPSLPKRGGPRVCYSATCPLRAWRVGSRARRCSGCNHKGTKAQRHKESRQTKILDAGFLCVFVPLCLCGYTLV